VSPHVFRKPSQGSEPNAQSATPQRGSPENCTRTPGTNRPRARSRPTSSPPSTKPTPNPQGAPPTHLAVGQVIAPWGIRGEIRARILTDFPDRFADLQQIAIGEDHRLYPVESTRLSRGEVFLKLGGIDSPEEADELRGQFLYVPLAEAVPLPEGHYYHHQILGLEVWTGAGVYLGQVTDILETGANDVYVVQKDGREVLIPALVSVLQQVDLEHHRLVVNPPPGLLDEEEA
jgi:16S rRNA processing protein RimM